MNVDASRAVIVEGLSVQFGRSTLALDRVDLSIGTGLFGLLGPNGVGKTTLMRTLATLQQPTRGSARVFGYDIQRDAHQFRRILGYYLWILAKMRLFLSQTPILFLSGTITLSAALLGFFWQPAQAQRIHLIDRHDLSSSASVDFRIPAVWDYSAPLIAPEKRQHDPSRAQKDPTVVFHDGRWHVFMTVKLPGRSAIEYCSFAEWEDADTSKRTILNVSDSDYYCAPQVFYFTPHQKWYLVYQMGVPGADKMWVAYSTTSDISDPQSWTRASAILDGGQNDPREVGGLDYWIICDDQHAYLFFTSLNGKMWRMWTNLADFPKGFGHCEVALTARIFEASHTYRLKGLDKYLTVIEEDGRRYYKAFIADRLDGTWTPIADSPSNSFASWMNIRPAQGVEPWTDNVSHGELIRDGNDQTLTVDPHNLRFVFQGMMNEHKSGKGYGQFQWRIGMLTPGVIDSPDEGE